MVVVVDPETSVPKVSADPCLNPLAIPATPLTPPKPAPPQQVAAQTPVGDNKRKPEPPAEVIEVPKALPAERVDQRRMLVEMCIRALFLCLSRFPQHYKSLYRLAYFYTNSKTHKVSLPLLTHTILNVGIIYGFFKGHLNLFDHLFCWFVFYWWSFIFYLILWELQRCTDCVGYEALWTEVCVGVVAQSPISQFGMERESWALLWWQPSVSTPFSLIQPLLIFVRS